MPGIFIDMSTSGDNLGSGEQSVDEIVFLTFEQVEAIHRDQLDRFGGQDGYRNRHLIESAVDAPNQTMFGNRLYEDIAAMASVYLFQIGESQGFTDGNKRTGVAACVTFLALKQAYRVTIDVHERKTDRLPDIGFQLRPFLVF
jgi:death-on-curing protein